MLRSIKTHLFQSKWKYGQRWTVPPGLQSLRWLFPKFWAIVNIPNWSPRPYSGTWWFFQKDSVFFSFPRISLLSSTNLEGSFHSFSLHLCPSIRTVFYGIHWRWLLGAKPLNMYDALIYIFLIWGFSFLKSVVLKCLTREVWWFSIFSKKKKKINFPTPNTWNNMGESQKHWSKWNQQTQEITYYVTYRTLWKRDRKQISEYLELEWGLGLITKEQGGFWGVDGTIPCLNIGGS